ncbi:MAG: recombinase family protein [Planctomycetaceae bacterium]|nr:recombinase family protein [Planctomycetaceae bacterium]
MATCPECGDQQDVRIPNSIEYQRERLLRYCEAKWMDGERPHIIIVPELVSTTLKAFDNRSESSKILNSIRKGDYFIACRLDRAWRSAHDFHKTFDLMHQRGVTVIMTEQSFDSSTAIGWAMASMSAVFAELERRNTSERTKQAIKSLRERGFSTGNHVKFGTRVGICQKTGKKIIVDDINELRMAKWVYIMRFVKRIPWETLVPVAEQLGFRNRAGKPFNYNKLKDMGTDARRLHRLGKLDQVS